MKASQSIAGTSDFLGAGCGMGGAVGGVDALATGSGGGIDGARGGWRWLGRRRRGLGSRGRWRDSTGFERGHALREFLDGQLQSPQPRPLGEEGHDNNDREGENAEEPASDEAFHDA